MLGETVGSYKIVDKIGEGGMGAVYRAEHTMLGRHVAIKVLLAELSKHENIVKRFFNEAKAATAIHHPGIVEVFDFGHHSDGSAYIVMELLKGEPLSTRLRREKKLSEDKAVEVIQQIAAALRAAHTEGITHRDLKPDNVFLIPDPLIPTGERIKLLDFGIAKLSTELRGDLEATRAGAVLGTPPYMAPEQCVGSTDVDHRSDLYALGCLFFHLLCGQTPFTADQFGAITIEHLTKPPPKPSDLEPTVTGRVERVVLQLLEKKPEDRFQSCGQLIAALEGKRIRKATPVPIMPGFEAAPGGATDSGGEGDDADPAAPTQVDELPPAHVADASGDAAEAAAPPRKKTKLLVQPKQESKAGSGEETEKEPEGPTGEKAAAPALNAAKEGGESTGLPANLIALAVVALLALAAALYFALG